MKRFLIGVLYFVMGTVCMGIATLIYAKWLKEATSLVLQIFLLFDNMLFFFLGIVSYVRIFIRPDYQDW